MELSVETAQVAETPRGGRKGSKQKFKSRITNTGGLPDLDWRTKAARRIKDITALYTADLSASPSEAQKAIILRAASATVALEQIETRLAEGAATIEEVDAFLRATGNLRRLLETLGLQRRVHRALPPGAADLTLSDFIRQQAR
jgi:hypothetical protein